MASFFLIFSTLAYSSEFEQFRFFSVSFKHIELQIQYNNCFFWSVPRLLPSVIEATLQARSVLRPRSTFPGTDLKHCLYYISKARFFLPRSFWKSDSDFFEFFCWIPCKSQNRLWYRSTKRMKYCSNNL